MALNLPLWAQFALVWLSGLITAAALLAWIFRGAIASLDRTIATGEPVAGTFGPFGSWAAKRCRCGQPDCRLVHVAVNGTPGSRMTMPTDEQAAATVQAMTRDANAAAVAIALNVLLWKVPAEPGETRPEQVAARWLGFLHSTGRPELTAVVWDYENERFTFTPKP